jgi:hypothetical protein
MRAGPHLVGRTQTGASATGQGRANSTAATPRTLDAAPASAGYHRDTKTEAIHIAHLKRVVTLGMVLSRYGVLADLKRVGSQLAGPCPIHGGSDPRQFVVHLASNNWFCFSPHCNRGGTMLDFVALKEHTSIGRAAQLVAAWFAVPPPSFQPQPRQHRRPAMTETSNQPTHRVYSAKRREGADKDDLTPIGSAWVFNTKDGRAGMNVILSALPLGERMVIFERNPEWEEQNRKDAPPTKRK